MEKFPNSNTSYLLIVRIENQCSIRFPNLFPVFIEPIQNISYPHKESSSISCGYHRFRLRTKPSISLDSFSQNKLFPATPAA